MTRRQQILRIAQESSLYGLLFLLPFSKAAIEILFGCLLFGWIVERLDSRTRFETIWVNPRLRSIVLAVGAYLAVCALSIAVSDFPALSARGFVAKWVEYLGLFVIAADLGARPMIVRRSASVIAWSSFFVVVEAVTQEVFGKGLFRGITTFAYARMTGPYENPIDLATYFMVVIPLLLSYVFLQRKVNRGLLWGVLIFLVVCLGRTMALGVWMAFGFAVIVILVRGPKAVRRNALILSGIILLSAGYFLHRTGYTHQVLTLSDVGTSDRIAMWQSAAQMIKDRPVLGHGVNTFMANYLAYWVGGEQQPRYAHNCYLQVAAETGLLGLAAFLWLLWAILSRIAVARNAPSEDGVVLLGLLAGLVAFVIHSAIDTNFYALRQAALFWILAGLAVGLSERILRPDERGRAA